MLDSILLGFERWVRADVRRLDLGARFIPRAVVRRLNAIKLARTLRYVWDHSPAQRERWRQAGLTREDLASPDALERIPFTTANDIVTRPEEFLCTPPDDLIHIVQSSGTSSGQPKNIYLTRDDLDRQTGMTGVHFRRFPGSKHAMLLALVRTSSWTAGVVTGHGLARGGVRFSLSTADEPAASVAETIRRERVDTLWGSPTSIHRVTVEMAGIDLRALGVRWIHVVGQAFTDAWRRDIEAAWGALTVDGYGAAETGYGMAGECRFRDGLHVSETDFCVEIVDPATGQVLPEGVEGEMVVTTLSRRGMPLVRYRTSDLTRLLPRGRRCPCGLPVRKIARIRGRVDDIVMLGSINFCPEDFDRVLLGVAAISDYQIVVEQEGFIDILHVTVETDRAGDGLRDAVIEALLSIPNLRKLHEKSRSLRFGRVEAVARGTLTRGRPKSTRIVDRRDG